MSRALFQNFFPAWRGSLRHYLQNECQPYYEDYKHTPNLVYGVVECLLEQFPPFRQLEMNSSSVILGLTPTILQVLGVNTVQTSLLSLRRPVLVFVLSMGLPSVSPLHSQGHVKAIKETFPYVERRQAKWLQTQGEPQRRDGFTLVKSLICEGTVFACALGAAANNWYLAYQLGYWSICMFAVGDIFVPFIWQTMATAVHVVGVISFHLTLSVDPKRPTAIPKERRSVVKAGLLWMQQRHHPLILTIRNQGPQWRKRLLQFVNWGLFVGTAAYVAFGSVVLASLVFISVEDALTILCRYLASTVVCRLVLMSELSRMGDTGVALTGEDESCTCRHVMTEIRGVPPATEGKVEIQRRVGKRHTV